MTWLVGNLTPGHYRVYQNVNQPGQPGVVGPDGVLHIEEAANPTMIAISRVDEPKRVPGEVTSLLDPFNLTDEALRYRRECGGGMYGAVWVRKMVELIDDHQCGEGCLWAVRDSNPDAWWDPTPGWSGYIEWEEAC